MCSHGQRVYEVAGDNVHHHMICQSCWGDEKIPHEVVDEFIENVQDKYGFLAQPHHLFLLGLCKQCQEEEAKQKISKEKEEKENQ